MRTYLLTLLLLLSITTAAAQGHNALKRTEMMFGVSGGTTASRIRFSPKVDQTFRWGIEAGGIWRYVAEKHFGIQAELNYMQRGWDEDSGYSCRLDYLEIPFMSHMYFGRKARVIINLGPKVGWLVGRSPKADPTATEVQHHAADNRFDYGICGGLGFELHPNRNAFFVEARFYMGLSDLYDNSKTSYFGSSGNINFTFKLGWLFNANK